MRDRLLEITVWDYDRIGASDFLGEVRTHQIEEGRKCFIERRTQLIYLRDSEIKPKCSLCSARGCQLTVEREREMFYLTTHSTHFIYGYMASDIW